MRTINNNLRAMDNVFSFKNRLFFHPEDVAEPNTEAKGTTETKSTDSGTKEFTGESKEPKGADKASQQLHKYIYNGESVEMNDDQRDRLVGLGIQKAQEMLEEQNKKPETKETKNDDVDPRDAKIAELESKLEGKIRNDQNASFMKSVSDTVKSAGLSEVSARLAREISLSRVALAVNKNKNLSPDEAAEIAASVVKDLQGELKSNTSITDGNGKVKDKEDMKLAGTSSKPASQEVPKHTRKSFKDGSLVKAIQNLYNGATE